MRGFLAAAVCVLGTAAAARCDNVVATTYTKGARITTVFYEDDPPKDRPPANNSPLRVGDVILEADGQKVESSEQFADVLGKAAGKSFKLVAVDLKVGLPFLVTLDLTGPKLKYGLKYDIVPVKGSVSEYYLSRP